jgi:hypothetical protein
MYGKKKAPQGPEEEVQELRKIIEEFLTDKRVLIAIASECVGNSQEDACTCLYCRAKKALF